MKKFIFILCLIPVLFLLSSCDRQESGIFLSNAPISLKNLSTFEANPTFSVRQKIYFLLVSKHPIENPVLRLQTIKLDNKYNYPIAQMEIPYAVDIERGENQYAITDYFVLHQDGTYFLRIFSLTDLDKPIAEAEFIVEKR